MKTSYIVNLKNKGNKDIGYLVPLEYNTNLPFEVKRIFYTYNVPYENNRGAHAYYKTQQVLICISGSLNIKCFDGIDTKIYELNPNQYVEHLINPLSVDGNQQILDHNNTLLNNRLFGNQDYAVIGVKQ